MIYAYQDIRHVHLEISSRCNAECPLCPRNFYGAAHNDGYIEHDMTLAQAQKIFPLDFIQQIDGIHVNGNFGDMVMNPYTVDIFDYFKSANPTIKIDVSTNGAARDATFWRRLAQLGIIVIFCIEGDAHTHSRYRRNTLYDTVIKNAQTFIAAGGHAVWKMVRFAHNADQFSWAEQQCHGMGFQEFRPVDHGRNTGPVFDTSGQLVDVLEPYTDSRDYAELIGRKQKVWTINDIGSRDRRTIACEVQRTRSVYVASTGHVYPCCYLGFAPESGYGHGSYLQVSNNQLREIISENSALEYGIAHAIEWFNHVSSSWDQSIAQGRLVMCNDACGRDNV